MPNNNAAKTRRAVEAGFAKQAPEAAERHAFLCTGPDCCAREAGRATWDALKSAVKETGARALRSKADCLRVCAGGPWLLVYPEGTWYGGVTPERCRRIVAEHLAEGRPVEEWIERRHPLGPKDESE